MQEIQRLQQGKSLEQRPPKHSRIAFVAGHFAGRKNSSPLILVSPTRPQQSPRKKFPIRTESRQGGADKLDEA
jgi:hypothetical protein